MNITTDCFITQEDYVFYRDISMYISAGITCFLVMAISKCLCKC